jgi:hypothetical protein
MAAKTPAPDICVRCGRPAEPGRRKYCSEACADSAQRALKKARKGGFQGLARFRVYDYRH